jgi:hypothetical protein
MILGFSLNNPYTRADISHFWQQTIFIAKNVIIIYLTKRGFLRADAQYSFKQ